MNQSLEKLIIIGLNLSILVSVGIPLLATTTQVLIEAESQLEIQQFIDEVDATLLFAEENWLSTDQPIYVPPNITISSHHNHLLFRFFIYNSWHMVVRSYKHNITVDGPVTPGPHVLHVTVNTSTFHLHFEPCETLCFH